MQNSRKDGEKKKRGGKRLTGGRGKGYTFLRFVVKATEQEKKVRLKRATKVQESQTEKAPLEQEQPRSEKKDLLTGSKKRDKIHVS